MKTELENTMQSIITAGWNVESNGNVEAPTGHFALVEIPSHAGELAEMRDAIGEGWETDPDAGWHVVQEDSNGFVWIAGPLTETEARKVYGLLEEKFYEWDDQGED